MNTPTLIILAVVAVVVVAALVISMARRSSPRVVDAPAERAGESGSMLGSLVRRALGSRLDEGTWDQLEEALLAADVGVAATTDVIRHVREGRPGTVDEAREALSQAIAAELEGRDRDLHLSGRPAVILVVGVNGTGKTTSIAKLAHLLKAEGHQVSLGAADTFRAAASEQLQAWGERLGVQVVKGQEGGDPASVAFDTIESARARGVDVVIIDTAGRLHGKDNLMAELQKIHRVAGGEAVDEVLLVLDASGGQNGLAQVGEFSKAVPVTGIILTKLDGTARGGIVIAVERALGVPVKFVGTGEALEDLSPFDPGSFVASLLA